MKIRTKKEYKKYTQMNKQKQQQIINQLPEINNLEYSKYNTKIKTNRKKVLKNLSKTTNNQIGKLTQQNKTIENNKNQKSLDKKKPIEKIIKHKYNSDKHKFFIECNYNNQTNNKINQFIISHGYTHYLSDNSNITSIDSQLKIITVRNTDMGITDNINQLNTLKETFGYPFKRVILNNKIKQSKDNLEYRKNCLFYGNQQIENNHKTILVKTIDKKKLIDNTFISKVFKLYSYLIETNNKENFSYHVLKNEIKTLNGYTFISIFDNTIKLIKTNHKRYLLSKNELIKHYSKIKPYINDIENYYFNKSFDKQFILKNNNLTINQWNKDKSKYTILKKLTLNKQQLRLYNSFINLLLNDKKIYHKNGLYKYNIQQLEYTLIDIEKNGYLDKEYRLKRLYGIKLTDKTVIKPNNINQWNTQKIKLLKLSKDKPISKTNNTTWNNKQKQIRQQIRHTKNRIKEIQQLQKQ